MFQASVAAVTNAVQKAYETWYYGTSRAYGRREWQGEGDALSKKVHTRSLQLVGHEFLLWRDSAPLAKGVFARPENQNDAFLYGGVAPYCESKVYFKDGQPLIYFADFHIHLAEVEPGKTRVEITTYDSRIAVGVDRGFSPLGDPGLRHVKIAPTSVEEYEILLGIGAELGVKDTPNLIAPGPETPSRSLLIRRLNLTRQP